MSRLCDLVLENLVRLIVLLTLGFLIAPIVITVLMSFDARQFLGAFPPSSFSLQWYTRFFSEPAYVRGLFNSLALGVASSVISVLLGTAAAIGLFKGRFHGRQAILSMFLAPLIVPAVVIGFSLLIVLSVLGVGPGYAKLLIAHCVITIPYVIRSVMAALANIGETIDEAAMSLGASHWTIVKTVTVPIARAGVVVGAVLAFTISFDDVSTGVFLADPDSTTLPLALVSMMRSNFDLSIAAASTFMIVVALVVLAITEWLIGVDQVFGSSRTEE